MSNRVLSHVLEHSKAKGSARLVLIVLADAANEQGIAWPKEPTIAHRSGMGERHVRRSIEELERLGELFVEDNKRGHRYAFFGPDPLPEAFAARVPKDAPVRKDKFKGMEQRTPVAAITPDTGSRSTPDTGSRSTPDTGSRSTPDTGSRSHRTPVAAYPSLIQNLDPPLDPPLDPTTTDGVVVESSEDDSQNIFRLYSARFDQPIHSRDHTEALKKLKNDYSWDWIVEAFMLASRKSKDWTYAEGILRNWRLKGRDTPAGDGAGGIEGEYDGLRYVSGEFASFIEH